LGGHSQTFTISAAFFILSYYNRFSCNPISCRKALGDIRRNRRKLRLKVLTVLYPTSKAMSVTLFSVVFSSVHARLIRRKLRKSEKSFSTWYNSSVFSSFTDRPNRAAVCWGSRSRV